MKLAKYIQIWTQQADHWLSVNAPHLTRDSIQTGRDAWTIAHRCGITEEAYKDREVTDAHIQTVLEKIFPNAIFKDKKRY